MAQLANPDGLPRAWRASAACVCRRPVPIRGAPVLFHYEPHLRHLPRQVPGGARGRGIPHHPATARSTGTPCSSATTGPHAERFLGRELDYGKVDCPACERICTEEGFWLYQKHFLGPESDMAQIAEAIRKVLDNRNELR